MGFLKGKKILITGISHERSIALGIAKALYKQKAQLNLVCQNKKIINKIHHLIDSMSTYDPFVCDVSNDENIILEYQGTWEPL